jgi:hypothetical protein
LTPLSSLLPSEDEEEEENEEDGEGEENEEDGEGEENGEDGEDGEDEGGVNGMQSPTEETKHDTSINRNSATINGNDETGHLTEAEILKISQIFQQALLFANKNVTSQLDAKQKQSTQSGQPVNRIIHRFSEQQQKKIRVGAKMMKLALTDVKSSHLYWMFCSGFFISDESHSLSWDDSSFIFSDDERNYSMRSSLKVALKREHFLGHGLDNIVRLPWGTGRARQQVESRFPLSAVEKAIKALWPVEVPLICEWKKYWYPDVRLNDKYGPLSFENACFSDFTYLFSNVSRPDPTPLGCRILSGSRRNKFALKSATYGCSDPEPRRFFRYLGRVW